MRPIRLEMTAFGPYKELTVVDFGRLGTGIYAITGPTGAGKTTIFDALMFALYEEVSAKGADSKENPVDATSVRSKSMVHCEFADPKTDTVVQLVFDEKGKLYTVKRWIHITPAATKINAELTGDGIPAVTGSSKVTEEIRRILGDLTSTRFRQIVMLAQGQFRAFLEAKDDKRKEILSNLFDSLPYQIFQERLKNAAKDLNQQTIAQKKRLEQRLQPDVFLLPETADQSLYSPSLPIEILRENLIGLTLADKEEEKELTGKEDALNSERSALERKIGAANAENDRFAELQRKKKSLLELEGRREEMERDELRLGEAERALHVVRPKQAVYDDCEKQEKQIEQQIETGEERLCKAKERLLAAEEDSKKNPERKDQSERLGIRIRRMQEHLTDYDERDLAGKRLSDCRMEIDNAEKKLAETSEMKAAAEDVLNRYEAELQTLTDAESRRAECEQEYRRTERALDLFQEPVRGFCSRVKLLRKERKELSSLYQSEAAASEMAEQAAKNYQEVHRRYLSGYAGKLGVELKAELEQNGEAVCPVCGTHFVEAAKASIAGITGNGATDEELNRAEESRTAADKKAREQTAKVVSASSAFEEKRDALLNDLNTAVPEFAPWKDDEELQHRVDDAFQQAELLCAEKKHFLEAADHALRRKKTLEKEIIRLQKEREEAAAVLAKENERRAAASAKIEHLQGEVQRLETALKESELGNYPDKASASSAIEELQKNKKKLDKTIADSEANLSSAGGEVSSLEGQLHTWKESHKEQKVRRAQARSAYEDALQHARFASEEDYLRALAHSPELESEQWIKAERERIQKYKNDCANTKNRIEELNQNPPQYTDLSVLKEKQEEMGRAIRRLSERRQKLGRQADSHSAALETLNEVAARLVILENAYDRMKNLSDVANGESNAGGKRTFDGYVLGSTFREVLDHASVYLDEMTGGKYTLIHDTEARGARNNAMANFRITVQDKLSGKVREIGSLSGGESFQASMALALGLSDTVQSHVGAVSINTMFIDEGFGTLDKDSLQRMLTVLTSLSDGKRQIGIISHVDDLKEVIGKFIRVTGSTDRTGSTLKIEV